MGLDISWDVSVEMAGGSLAERRDAHQRDTARTRATAKQIHDRITPWASMRVRMSSAGVQAFGGRAARTLVVYIASTLERRFGVLQNI